MPTLKTVHIDGQEVCIRTGTVGDVARVLRLWQEAETLPTVTDTEEALRELLHCDPEALLVAVNDGEIVGSLIAAWNGWRGSFYRLAVRPGFRRRGIGIALLRVGENHLRQRGARRVDAVVDASDPAAMAFWGAAAYKRQAHRSRFVRNLAEQ